MPQQPMQRAQRCRPSWCHNLLSCNSKRRLAASSNASVLDKKRFAGRRHIAAICTCYSLCALNLGCQLGCQAILISLHTLATSGTNTAL